MTTSDDFDCSWGTGEWQPAPVTRKAFAYVILTALYGTVRLVVCTLGIHRRRGWKS